jgi:hypothetical protein
VVSVRVDVRETERAFSGWVRVRVLLPWVVVTGAGDQVLPVS